MQANSETQHENSRFGAKKYTHRYASMGTTKSTGSTYTPPSFATFVAKQIVNSASLEKEKIRVLDPAVGDGALIEALINELPESLHSRLKITAYDTSRAAIIAANERIKSAFPHVEINFEERDFLALILNLDQPDLIDGCDTTALFDLIIANPPYVRTQIIGAAQSQRLADQFGLSGRIDLYHPFLLGMSQFLAPDGVAGVITSNRFMTTKSGQTLRRELLSRLNVLHVWDMGDTKLFSAAVLPSVLLAKGGQEKRTIAALKLDTHQFMSLKITPKPRLLML